MNKRLPLLAALLVAIFAFLFVKIPPAFTEIPPSFSVTWYLNRAEKDMSIANYRAAIESYEKALAISPGNLEALFGLARAYEGQGLVTKAAETYSLYLEKKPGDAETAFKLAQMLEDPRFAHRKQDALQYYDMGLRTKDDPAMRLRYARLLGANKATSTQAIEQYELILKKDPANAEVRYGLAKAYAWNGRLEQARDHARQAAQQDPKLPGLEGFLANLETSTTPPLAREERSIIFQPTAIAGHPLPVTSAIATALPYFEKPQLGVSFQYFTQHGINFGLQGLATSLLGQRDLSKNFTAAAEAGFGTYWNEGDHAGGPFFSLRGQYRLSPNQRLDVAGGYHDLEEDHADNWIGRVQYGLESGRFWMRSGFKRELKYDSFLSLVGKTVGGQNVGAARSNLFFVELGYKPGRWELNLIPYGGWVKARSLAANPEIGSFLIIKRPLLQETTWRLSGEYVMQVLHDEEDQSGFVSSATEPLPGGYFSPHLFINQTPRLALRWQLGRQELEARAGPSFQYVNTTGSNGAYHLGGEGELSYQYHFTDHWTAQITPGATKIAEVYTRVYVTGLLSYTF